MDSHRISPFAKFVLNSFTGESQRRKHFFVDLAANDPIDGSSTYDLERYGWSGLCIEPNPRFAALLRKHRKCKVVESAVDSKERNVTFQLNGAMGGIEDVRFDNRPGARRASTKSMSIHTRPFANVLRDASVPRVISYLSLDVEGAEAAVLPSWFPWRRYTFLTLSIERSPPPLNELLFKNKYLFVRNLGTDALFVHSTHPRASTLESNKSFLQIPAKCKNHMTRYLDRVQLPGPCRSIFGCCTWPDYPPPSTQYQQAVARRV